MLSSKLLRDNLDYVVKELKKRNYNFDEVEFINLENARKVLQIETQNLQKLRNEKSRLIGKAKADGKDIKALMLDVEKFATKLEDNKNQLKDLQSKIHKILLFMPNIPHNSVPVGNNENDNVEIYKWSEPFKYDFEIKDHVELGKLHGIDFAVAAKIAGTRFALMKDKIAKLHRALIQFMLDRHSEVNGYLETYVPYLVNAESMMGTGQLPKFEEDLFKTNLKAEDGASNTLYLIPTAEVPLTNIVRESILEEKDLPLKFVSHTPCFRSEAGSYGKDTKGLIRQHQFEKVELVHISKAQDSYKALEELTLHAEGILKELKLPYRKVLLCSGDLGFSSAKTYDIEVWLPGQNKYREISSCSCFEDFQARRIKLRWRNPENNSNELLHTLNGSGLAVGRTLVAVMENYQQEDGSIVVPEVLQNYMSGLKIIK